jgi:hypothetical protein
MRRSRANAEIIKTAAFGPPFAFEPWILCPAMQFKRVLALNGRETPAIPQINGVLFMRSAGQGWAKRQLVKRLCSNP